jgi:hypothetical protein
MHLNTIRKRDKIDFYLGRTRMYFDNARQQIDYPWIMGQQIKIKITKTDLADIEFMKLFRRVIYTYVDNYSGYQGLSILEYPSNEFWLVIGIGD